jgi:hypothetical protein
MSLADNLIERVRSILHDSSHFPRELYATWDYVEGENRVCHQRTTALLAHAAWTLPSTPVVEQEDCFVAGRDDYGKQVKWHPDLVLRSGEDTVGKVLLFVDFESPNSSDFRVIDRDVKLWYVNWCQHNEVLEPPEYLIVTSLPDAQSPRWWCRYAKSDGYEAEKARENPFLYWYGKYRTMFEPAWKRLPIRFANFNGNELGPVEF